MKIISKPPLTTRILRVAVVLIFVGAIGFGGWYIYRDVSSDEVAPNTASIDEQAEVTQPTSKEIAQELLDSLSLEQKIGQLIFVGYDGEGSQQQLQRLVQNSHVGGVMLMDANLDDLAETKLFIEQLNEQGLQNTQVQPFIAIDQEGGVVSRITDPQYDVTSQTQILSAEQAREVAQARAQELTQLGISVNFSPVLENISNPNSFLYQRVFRGGNEEVSEYGSIYINTYQANGLHATAKHFPGHADDSADSHLSLPVLSASDEDFIEHIAPFSQTLQRSSPDFVMVGHVQYPNQDPTYPSSISPTIIETYLRGELDYDGLVITDDLSMQAIAASHTPPEAAVQAIIAGNDMLLYVEDEESIKQIIATINDATEAGEITQQRIDQSVLKILETKISTDQ